MPKILVVDDEKSIRKTFEAFLTKEGFEITSAENVDAAIKTMDETDLDLIITDIIMPKITGMELLKIIKDKKPDIPIIIMTGEPTIETATQAVKNGAHDYITKPVSKEMLVKTVRNALEHKRLLDNKRQLEAENAEYRENLEKLVEKRTKALQEAMHATISTIASVLELRDPYTAGHERKVGNLAVEIGRKMKLSKKQIECIYVAGYLHDIGKISVPAEILSKPGKLSDIEYEIIKTHVKCGYDVLKKVKLPWPVAEVVYQHHERIDGSGYPRGLKGNEMKVESKIMAIADVIEAMTSHRPYRPGLGLDIALEEIESNSGKTYDEKAATAALDLFRNDKYKIIDEAKEIKFEL